MSEIKIDKRNYRKHSDRNKSLINKSLSECGAGRSILIDNENSIVAGNGIFEQAQKLDIPIRVIETDGTELIAVKRTDLATDDEKRKQLAVMDNSTSDSSEFDFDLLKEDFSEDELVDFGIDGLEIDDSESQDYLDENDLPSEDTPVITKLGDLWALGNHRLLCGDSTKIEDIEKLMNGEKADMVFTDPPYNVSYADKNAFLNSVDNSNRIQDEIRNDHFKNDEEIKESLWKPAFKNMAMSSKETCSIYVTMPQGGAHMMMMMESIADAGWQVKHELVWVKNNHVLGRSDYFYKHEPILYGWKDKHVFYGNGKFNTSVWEINKPLKSDLHPTMKPIELISEALLNSSQKDDQILDTFGGSGSTLIACEQLNRKCYMMEIDPKYCDVIIRRWQKLTGQQAIHEASGKSFDELSNDK